FLKAWGKKGAGPGEFDTPHGLAIDSRGRLFVADRGNSRIQIFDADGSYVADSSSDEKRNPGFSRGIWIGSARDGSVTAFVPHPDPDPKSTAAEGVVADAAGRIYAAANNSPLVRYTKE